MESSGEATAVGNGTATITASVGGVSGRVDAARCDSRSRGALCLGDSPPQDRLGEGVHSEPILAARPSLALAHDWSVGLRPISESVGLGNYTDP